MRKREHKKLSSPAGDEHNDKGEKTTMGKMNELGLLLETLAGTLEDLAALCRGEQSEERDAVTGDAEQMNISEPEPITATLEQVRGVLAEKARNGFRAEVKALLTAHGAKQLSDITDPAELGALMKEAEKFGG